ncbi:unnamed protein product [Linum tenue]|uniref:F-box domain-containing protein n=1 Tax=Linum tenue TaxID=586396 RepID=A0AAV0RBQ7_9ROSI|nr:unnamed protein product [Linum tenue]
MNADSSSCELGKPAKGRIAEEEEEGNDRLISLPDVVLHRILSLLDTKSVVQTSVLSRLWRNTWKDVSVLKFHSDSFKQYSSFQTYVDKVLTLRHPVGLSEVEYLDHDDSEDRDGDLFVKVIDYARTHDAQELEIDLFNHGRMQPSCVFSLLFNTVVSDCKLKGLTLKCLIINTELAPAGFRMLKKLNLTTCLMATGRSGDFDIFSGLPCLKYLYLIQCVFISFPKDDDSSSFTISGPQLDTLNMEVSVSAKINIRAPKLKFFNLRQDLGSLNLFSLSIPSLEIADLEIYDKTNSMEADKESMTQSLMFLFQGLRAARAIALDSITIQILSKVDSAFLEQQPSPFTKLNTLIVVPDTVPYLLVDYFLKGSTDVNPIVMHILPRVTFSGLPEHQQEYTSTSPWTPQSFDGGNNVHRSWFQRQDGYDEYDLKEMEYSAAVAAAAFAISSSLEEEEAGAADYRRKMEEDERRRSMGRPKSIIKEETPISRLASFRNLSIKEDRDPGESSDRRARQQQQERGFPARRPSLSSGGEDSWEKAQLRKISKRYEKMEAKIVGWQEAKKMQTKLKMERKRNELEMRRTRNMQHYQGKMERIDMIASGAKGQLEEKRRKEEAEVKHKARLNLHSKGRTKNSCFGWN